MVDFYTVQASEEKPLDGKLCLRSSASYKTKYSTTDSRIRQKLTKKFYLGIRRPPPLFCMETEIYFRFLK